MLQRFDSSMRIDSSIPATTAQPETCTLAAQSGHAADRRRCASDSLSPKISFVMYVGPTSDHCEEVPGR